MAASNVLKSSELEIIPLCSRIINGAAAFLFTGDFAGLLSVVCRLVNCFFNLRRTSTAGCQTLLSCLAFKSLTSWAYKFGKMI